MSFGETTDAQFAAIISALDEGKITVNDLPWKVGDERTIHLSAMPATYIDETQPEQEAIFVIQNIGGLTFTNGKPCHYVVGMKDCLTNTGYISTNMYSASWAYTSRRKWCNEVFRNAIPETIRGCFKQFKCISGEYNSSAYVTTDDYFTLPAEAELYLNPPRSASSEANALSMFEWYKENHYTKYAGNLGTEWWIRSAVYNSNNYFCTAYGGASYIKQCKEDHGISPYGCI